MALGAEGDLEISTQPGVFPAFSADVADYVTRCDSATPVKVAVKAPAGTEVAVDGQAARGGTFTTAAGLRADQSFSMTATSAAGEKEYRVRCLPQDFPTFTAERSGTTQAQWYFVTPCCAFGGGPANISQNYVAVFDNNGVPVWWMHSAEKPYDAKLLSNGNIIWSRGGAEERRFDGDLVRTIDTTGITSDIHDVQLLPNGDYLLMAYKPREGFDLRPYGGPEDATIIDAELQQVQPDGTMVRKWDASEHIPLSDVPDHWWPTIIGPGGSARQYDVYHINSAELNDGEAVLSFRVLDAIYNIDWSSGAVDWKLGGVTRSESLTVAGDPIFTGGGSIRGQHDARILSDGTLTLHDNGTVLDGAGNWTGHAPRAVRYRLDEATRTATMIESVSDSRVPRSVCCGSSRRLDGGNWVSAWGGNSLVTEQSAGGNPIFSLTLGGGLFSYRANPVEHGVLSADTLRDGMDSQHPREAGGDQAIFTNPTDGEGGVDTTEPVTWTTVPGAEAYGLWVGSEVGGYDLVSSGDLAADTSSYDLPSLPTGKVLHARLWTKRDGVWSRYQDITFTVNANGAKLTSPSDGESGFDTTKSFEWTSAAGAQEYAIWVGTTSGGHDLLSSGGLPSSQSSYSMPGYLPALPTGRTLYVRLWTKVNGTWSRYSDTTFTAGPGLAQLTSPVDGQRGVDTTKPATWTRVAGAEAYALWVGSAAAGYDLVSSGEISPERSGYDLPGLPPGKVLHARLWTKLGGVWARYQDITFTAKARGSQRR